MEATDSGKQIVYSRLPLFLQSHPWLVISHGKQRQRQTFFSLSEDRYYVRVIPDLRNKSIHACSYGWLVLVDHASKDCLLFNPVSMERIQLPPMDSSDHDICFMTAPPSNPDCHVVFMNSNRLATLPILFCKPSDNEFDEQVLDNGEDSLARATAFGGKIYVVYLNSTCLKVLDFSGLRPQFRPLLQGRLQVPLNGIVRVETYLIESSVEILVVEKMYLGLCNSSEVLGFLVFRADFSEKSWIEVKSIGKRALFLGPTCGMSCSSAPESGIQENSIYYIETNDRCLYVFNLENQSVSISVPCPIVSRRHSQFRWIMPSVENNL